MKKAKPWVHYVYITGRTICGEDRRPPTVDAAAVDCPHCRPVMLCRIAAALGGKVDFETPDGDTDRRDWFWDDVGGVVAGTDRQDIVRLKDPKQSVHATPAAASAAYLLALRDRIDQLLGRQSLIPLGTRVKYSRPAATAVVPEEGLGYLVGVDYDDPVRRVKLRYKVLRDGFADSGAWMYQGTDEVIPVEVAGP